MTGLKFAAYEIFGEMRSSTDEERALFEEMLARESQPLEEVGLDLLEDALTATNQCKMSQKGQSKCRKA